MTSEQRKHKTEALLNRLNISINEWLPLIEDENEARIRNAKDIAKRILILVYLNVYAEDESVKKEVIVFLERGNLWDSVSQMEKKLFSKEYLSTQEKRNISWRSEAIWLMLWAIGKVDKLELPIEQCDVQNILRLVPPYYESSASFVNTAKVRPLNEILDISDLTYRLHWAVRDAELNGNPIPANLNSSIIEERHYAINWVTYYEEDWDNITTDT
jgi:hypothetical protein